MINKITEKNKIYYKLNSMLNKDLIQTSNTYNYFFQQIQKLLFLETKSIEWAKFLLQIIEYYDNELTSLRLKLEKYEKETTRKNID